MNAPEMTPGELARALEAGDAVQILDVRAPQWVAAGHIDLAPTLLDAAHIEGKGADFDGASLLDRGLGARPEGAFTHTAHAFSPELKHRTSLFALQTGRWKLLYDPTSERMRLFDLDKDAGELEDLAGDPAFDELCRRFRDRIKAWIKRYEGKSPSGFYELDDETLKAFEQLGYAF